VKSLNNKEQERLRTAGATLADLFAELEVEREAFTGTMARIMEKMAEARQEAWEVLDDAANSADEYYDERSEKWQEGDVGQAYDEWRNRIRSLADEAAEDVEPLDVAEIDIPGWVDELRQPEDFAEFESPL
jgi:chromosome segregation ATPase